MANEKIVVDLILRDKDFKKGVQDAVGDTKKLEKTGNSSTQRLSTGFKAVAGAIAAMGLYQLGKDMQNLAAQSQGVQSAFKNSFGNAPETLRSMKEATGGTVSNLSLMQKALNAKNLKIPVDTLNAGLKLARQRAAETGESVEFLANSVVLGLGRESALILDNLGISAKRLAEETARTGNFMKAAANIINSELANAPPTITTLADAIGQVNAEAENMKEQLALELTPVFQMLQKEALTFLNILKDAFNLDAEFKFQKKLADNQAAFHEAAKGYAKDMEMIFGDKAEWEITVKIARLNKQLRETENEIKNSNGANTELLETYNKLAREVSLYELGLQYLNVTEKDLSKGAIEEMNAKIKTQKELINAAAEKDLPALNLQLQLMEERLNKLQNMGKIEIDTSSVMPLQRQTGEGEVDTSGRDPVGEIKKVKIALEEVNEQVDIGTLAAQSFASSFADAFVNAGQAGLSFGEAMNQMLMNVASSLAKTLIQAALLQAILGGVTGGASVGLGGIITSGVGGLFSGNAGGSMNLTSSIRGNDIYMSNQRTAGGRRR